MYYLYVVMDMDVNFYHFVLVVLFIVDEFELFFFKLKPCLWITDEL